MSLSDYSERKLNDWLTGRADMPAASNRFLALFVGDPTDAANSTEVSGGGYARVDIKTSPKFPIDSGTDGQVQNDQLITFPTATADWASGANIDYFGIFDASTSGNLLGSGPVTVAKPVLNGDTPEFKASKITITTS